jgi:hypothetical protein
MNHLIAPSGLLLPLLPPPATVRRSASSNSSRPISATATPAAPTRRRWRCLNSGRRHRYSIAAMNLGSIHDPIQGRIDRLAEIQSESDRPLECVTRRVAAAPFIDHAFGRDRGPMRVRLSVPAGILSLSLSLPGEGRRCEDGAERDDGKKRFHRMFHGSSPKLRHRWVKRRTDQSCHSRMHCFSAPKYERAHTR